VIILAVHSSSSSLSAAILEDENVLGEETLPPDRKHLEHLAPLIKRLTGRVKVGLADVDALAVAKGPGSFSGIRIGMATVKGIALALKKPVCAVSSLDIIAMQGLKPGERGIAVIDARRNEVYSAMYKIHAQGVEITAGPVLTDLHTVANWVDGKSDTLVLCGEPVVERLAELSTRPCEARIIIPTASTCATAALPGLRDGRANDIHTLTPLYIRKSDAEEKRR
jgi:tRNA threonylcarbamoyladenosine biosynthesis protein TsaB